MFGRYDRLSAGQAFVWIAGSEIETSCHRSAVLSQVQYRTRVVYTRRMELISRLQKRTSMVCRPCAALWALITVGVPGCAADSTQESYLAVPKGEYERYFLAASEVARAEGLAPELSDRASGTIETEPRLAGSVVEPWAWKELTFTEVIEGTFGFERRRARFEFVPSGFRPIAPEGSAPLAGPVLPGSERGSGADLARASADLELRVSVSVERQFQPGHQGPAYTRSMGSYSRDVTLEKPLSASGAPRDRSSWTPIARDERLERILLEKVRERATNSANDPNDPAPQASLGSTNR